MLDVACGTGYGLGLLSTPSRQAFGVDSDLGALQAAIKYGPVSAADGSHLPFANETFDTVTTFETLEHLHDRQGFLGEIGRVLRPGGTLILSTPNANYTRPINGVPKNPHHVHEYDPDELRRAVEIICYDVRMFGQVINRRFVISPFVEDQGVMNLAGLMGLRLFWWRVLNKLPAAPRDRLSYLTWGHPLYPTQHDYEFLEGHTESAPVLFVVAQRR